MNTTLLAIEVLYFSAVEVSREARRANQPPYTSAFELTSLIVTNNSLGISHGEIIKLVEKAIKEPEIH